MAEIDLIKISELPATSTIGDADELAVVQGGATKKVPYSALKAGAEVTPDTTLSEAGVPADAAAVGAALAQKANQAAVTQALAAKADKTEVAGISDDIAELASVVERKADQTALNQKADKTTTDALRQDLTTLNGIVNQKADKTELNAQIGNVTAELATKANTADVNNLLAAKANVASPVFTGRPQAPTAPKGTATLQLATTAFVQNAIDDKQDTLTFDTTPTEGSTNPVTSGGVWEAVQTDKTLAVEDKAADAKITGNAITNINDFLYKPVNEEYSLNIQEGAYLATTKEYWSNSGYRCAIIEATSADKVFISTRSADATTVPVALFYNGTPSASTYIGLWGQYTQETVLTNVQLPIPDGTTHIVINCRRFTDPFTAYKVHQEINSKIRNGGIAASFTGDTLTLKTRYTDTETLMVQIGKGGGNNLVDFRRIAGISTADASTVFEFNQNTDWFGPYIVRATENADGDLPDNWYSHFTGGNHQYNNSGSGSTPTARCVINKVLFDGKTATSDETYCSMVEMWWTNYIQGQNTKKADGTGREVLKENYYLRFDGKTFEVEHSFTPLEAVTMRRYYGLQANWNNNLTPQYNFIGGTSRALKSFSSAEVTSGDKNCHDFYIIDSLNNRLLIHLGRTDLGAMGKNGLDYSAFQSYSKVYFNLVNGNDWQAFPANDMYFYTGKIKISREY